MKLTIEEIIRLHKGKSCLHKQDKILKDKIKTLQREHDKLQEQLRIAESVSFIYKGIPMSGWMTGWKSLVPLANGNHRSGGVYINANNKKTWGIKLHTGLGFYDEVWLGAGYPSHEAAKRIVLEFLVTGKVLPERDRKYA